MFKLLKIFTLYVPYLRKLLQVALDQNKGVNQEGKKLGSKKRDSGKGEVKEMSGAVVKETDPEMCASGVEETTLDTVSAALGETFS